MAAKPPFPANGREAALAYSLASRFALAMLVLRSSCTAAPAMVLKLRCKEREALAPLQLATIAAEPVVKIPLLCGAGALCARLGFFDLHGRRMLSTLIMNVFTPALLLSKLGSSVDARQALELWPLGANMVLCHCVGLILGWAQCQLLEVPQTLRPQMLVTPALGNIGNLPLVLVRGHVL
eukprot:gene2789-3080_t